METKNMMEELKTFSEEKSNYLNTIKKQMKELEKQLPFLLSDSDFRYIFEVDGDSTKCITWDSDIEKIIVEIRMDTPAGPNQVIQYWDFASSPAKYRLHREYDDFFKSLYIACNSPYKKIHIFYEEREVK